ncbi:hypothetical protein ITP53_16615 [Nonomuraea sp. K274]|uniref:DUF6745 domain-containing protein n=1 Tax=Nonomuraea cypriaca TaxID=1187855 RepID=A0A931F0P1_9ACTN|nr:hypothetical protein [Nonomuraea cypriaca]MBF8187326.1 hypothetical protein [Nonomuraea cypriaca]
MSFLVQRDAAEIREQWLGWALSTLPADRPAAEAAISGLYDLVGLAPPRFHWVSSPLAALLTVPPGVRPRDADRPVSERPLPYRLRWSANRLHRELDSRIRPAQQPFDQVIRYQVRGPLARSVTSSLHPPLRAAHETPFNPATSWYTTQCVSWIAHYDALHRLAGVRFTPEQDRHLGLWAAAARSCGWWWPWEGVCVVSERPVTLHTEMADDTGVVRLHHPEAPAISYGDGWDLYSWHGTQVPDWVIKDPAAQRITDEPNVEVRRCAIERIGWDAYIEQAGLHLVATAPDPGNPGSELRLYDMRKETKVLLAVNGSVERDGRRRRYGLTVPGFLTDPLAAAGWTYGLSAEQYSRLLRRT